MLVAIADVVLRLFLALGLAVPALSKVAFPAEYVLLARSGGLPYVLRHPVALSLLPVVEFGTALAVSWPDAPPGARWWAVLVAAAFTGYQVVRHRTVAGSQDEGCACFPSDTVYTRRPAATRALAVTLLLAALGSAALGAHSTSARGVAVSAVPLAAVCLLVGAVLLRRPRAVRGGVTFLVRSAVAPRAWVDRRPPRDEATARP